METTIKFLPNDLFTQFPEIMKEEGADEILKGYIISLLKEEKIIEKVKDAISDIAEDAPSVLDNPSISITIDTEKEDFPCELKENKKRGETEEEFLKRFGKNIIGYMIINLNDFLSSMEISEEEKLDRLATAAMLTLKAFCKLGERVK